MGAVEELLKEMSEEGKDTFLLIRELSSFVAYYRRLLEKLELDALTGLPGANKYQSFRAGVETHSSTVGVIAFDVNDLKHYNDTMGHQAGDRLLQKAAESFHAVTDRKTQIFRTGGDEFVGIVLGCSESDMDGVVGRWQKKLAELNTADDGICCTIAFGTAYGAPGYKFDDVLALADERMYAEKRRMKECGLKKGELR